MVAFLMNTLGISKLLSFIIVGGTIFTLVAGSYGFVYLKGKSIGKYECQIEVQKATKKEENRQLKIAEALVKRDYNKALADITKIEELEKQVEKTPENNTVCFDDAAASRVRNIK